MSQAAPPIFSLKGHPIHVRVYDTTTAERRMGGNQPPVHDLWPGVKWLIVFGQATDYITANEEGTKTTWGNKRHADHYPSECGKRKNFADLPLSLQTVVFDYYCELWGAQPR